MFLEVIENHLQAKVLIEAENFIKKFAANQRDDLLALIDQHFGQMGQGPNQIVGIQERKTVRRWEQKSCDEENHRWEWRKSLLQKGWVDSWT